MAGYDGVLYTPQTDHGHLNPGAGAKRSLISRPSVIAIDGASTGSAWSDRPKKMEKARSSDSMITERNGNGRVESGV